MTRDDSNQNPEKLLADLADRMLNEGIDQLPAQDLDPETRALAETLLRLKRAFPREELDSPRVKELEKRVLRKWDEMKNRRKNWFEPIRDAWQTPARRPQFAMALAVIVIAGVLVLAGPLLLAGGDSVTGTAGREFSGNYVWLLLIFLVACLGWLLRRRP
jgi:hypothetical protein